jgi:hypothetical protein
MIDTLTWSSEHIRVSRCDTQCRPHDEVLKSFRLHDQPQPSHQLCTSRSACLCFPNCMLWWGHHYRPGKHYGPVTGDRHTHRHSRHLISTPLSASSLKKRGRAGSAVVPIYLIIGHPIHLLVGRICAQAIYVRVSYDSAQYRACRFPRFPGGT